MIGLLTLQEFLHSEFWAAFFGALVGALGAWIIARESERRIDRRGKLSATNKAVTLASTVLNAFENVRRQRLGPFLAEYQKEFEYFANATYADMRGVFPPGSVISLPMSYLEFPDVYLQMGSLADAALASGSHKALIASAQVTSAAQTFSTLVAKWRELGVLSSTLSAQEKPNFYFGVRQSGGVIDQRVPDILLALDLAARDVLFFSKALIAVLVDYGQQRLKGGRELVTVNLEVPQLIAVMPPRSEYPTWEGLWPPKRNWNFVESIASAWKHFLSLAG